MTILLKKVYRFDAIPIKLPMAFFTALEQKNFFNLYGNTKTLNSQNNLEKKKNEAGGIRLLDFRLHHKATVIKTVWYWHKNRNTEKWNRIGSLQTNPHNYGQLINNKGKKNIQ